MSLLPVAEAQARLFALADRLPVETVPIAQAVGRWLSQDIAALRDQPWADLSAMDGYAVRASEMPGPWRVTAESAAGTGLQPALGPGEASRIFTGAPLPPGADAILIQENATREGDRLTASADPLMPGRHVRPTASDFAQNAILLDAGSRLGPAQVALAVLGGHGTVPVTRRPRIAILSTGNELVPPGTPTPAGLLPSSNAPMLAALLAALPCDVIDLGIVPDDLDAMVTALDRASDADIIVSTGGASVGDHDLVRPAFLQAGGTLDFWKIRMRPGKPLMAGKLGNALFLGLPGNPVSAFVTATLFLLPLVRHISGAHDPLPLTSDATLASALPQTGDRDDYLRAWRAPDGIVSVTSQDSAATAAMAKADCLILRPAGSPPATPGTRVTILPL
ncbi:MULTISPECIES: molybdopterin molybdotransferase MoeA [Sphingobium]|jgi:molybdopterin molybdotransferase|uniref:molybdopterin molybdotransferase MoeA n=1 Tax=Sphingobium TaxID=165695 RepID=UPI000DBAEACC|nr:MULTISPECIES: gephyrin-like molybdotransferase Glp [Sphingobium]KAA9017923.1 molybdopterin molybdotransferase MoeA [Sphingobium limneticum]MBU0932553.1 molybdopterin molybdotransferase MoeA [Alphaproteobacteria bacterium]BBC99946.1 molybdopterin molybdotransferase [Sphingobium sp. YG1]